MYCCKECFSTWLSLKALPNFDYPSNSSALEEYLMLKFPKIEYLIPEFGNCFCCDILIVPKIRDR